MTVLPGQGLGGSRGLATRAVDYLAVAAIVLPNAASAVFDNVVIRRR